VWYNSIILDKRSTVIDEKDYVEVYIGRSIILKFRKNIKFNNTKDIEHTHQRVQKKIKCNKAMMVGQKDMMNG